MNLLGWRSRAVLAIATISMALLMNGPVLAQNAADAGLETTAAAAYGKPTNQLEVDPATIVGFFIRSALSLVGLIFMVLVIYGGFLWMTASGKEQQIDKARTLIVSAVIGMIIIAAGYALTSFVIGTVSIATGQ